MKIITEIIPQADGGVMVWIGDADQADEVGNGRLGQVWITGDGIVKKASVCCYIVLMKTKPSTAEIPRTSKCVGYSTNTDDACVRDEIQ